MEKGMKPFFIAVRGESMKIRFGNLIVRVTLLSAVLIAATAASAHGQSLANRARFNIPFDFAFGEKTLPAGQYTVGRAIQSSDDITLSITDKAGRGKGVQLSNAAVRSEANSKALLVFHRYGDQYFLVQVWQAGSTSGRQFMTSRRERDLVKQLAANSSVGKVAANAKYETVTVAAAF
jgi:hypothetical protein